MFDGLLPSTFTHDYVYWYDARTSMITLRSADNPWEEGDAGWTMMRDSSQWAVRKDNDYLVFPTGDTAGAFGDVFRPLEKLFGLNIIFNQQRNSMAVRIPRLNLEFSVNPASNRIQSRQYKGMHIDKNQCIRTLIGLQNKLVLCDSEGSSSSRMVLIPRDRPRLLPGEPLGISPHPSIQIDEFA